MDKITETEREVCMHIEEGCKTKHRKTEEYTKLIHRLNRIEGQVRGIKSMVEDERYCVDISNQIIAVQSLLKKANMQILRRHLDHCVKDAILHNNGDEKINEIINLFEKVSK